MSGKVGKQKALRLLRKAVAERGGDFVYPMGDVEYTSYGGDDCVYFTNTLKQPACIVGCVLDELGVADNDLDDDVFPASELNEHQDKVEFTEAALRVLYHAQVTQDRGDTWGKALKAAEGV